MNSAHGTPDRSRDLDQTMVTGPIDFDSQTAQMRMQDLPTMPPQSPFPSPEGGVYTTHQEQAERQEILEDFYTDMNARGDKAPHGIPTQFLPHNVFDFVTTTQYAIRIKTRSGGTYIGKWYPISQYAEDWKKITAFLETSRGENGQFVFAVEEGAVLLLIREVESITFFSREWYEAEYQARMGRIRGYEHP